MIVGWKNWREDDTETPEEIEAAVNEMWRTQDDGALPGTEDQ